MENLNFAIHFYRVHFSSITQFFSFSFVCSNVQDGSYLKCDPINLMNSFFLLTHLLNLR